ncbi:unnamed protein product [Echinostoma caproni]|uniref:GN3L_Grn1 domain-containing protein n=1 Tax=Echinostoma caproni TaxID=27848 RepID=A0A183BFB8_9TREM|nr:unnamed protein product [Echinostoma caproni]
MAKKRIRKDPGIPNNFPFKEDVFKHVEEFKKQAHEVHMYNLMHAKSGQTEKEMSTPISSALQREADKVIMEADVILEVLDARDPLGTRSVETEQKVLSAKKRLVIILNKIDLIPKANLQSWLTYLRQSFPVLPFKANTQQQNKNLGHDKRIWKVDEIISEKTTKFNKGVGVEDLLSLLANYARSGSKKPSQGENRASCLTVGVVGFPNTGKSAIINTLKRQKPEQLTDPIPAVEAILSRCPKQQLISKYDINDYTSSTDFLVNLAHRLGRLKKGGVPNTTLAARAVITDWIT